MDIRFWEGIEWGGYSFEEVELCFSLTQESGGGDENLLGTGHSLLQSWKLAKTG